ncbi:MAG: 16S rRNA (uracil(1498)-N(3))-methyltransferase [Actinomycetota bacterium]|nr:MAG: 16S rRNA (uracil(1498)-N(3))-methyltransferase [Actinomycetota bacterium]
MTSKPANPVLAESGIAHVIAQDLLAPELSEDVQHHLGTVRRLRTGDAITVGDGDGRWRTAILARDARGSNRGGIRIEFSSEIFEEARLSPEIVAGFCLPSLDRARWALQKMTEIGVDTVHLLYSTFSSTRRSGLEAGGSEYEKLLDVVREAAMQSRSPYLPRIVPIDSLENFVNMYPKCGVCTYSGESALIASEPVVIGPEGGFSDFELELFSRKYSLGRNVLRSETAAVLITGVLAMKRSGLL